MTEKAERIRQDVQDLMKAGDLSQTAVAKAAGISPAALNQWLKEKYQGDVEAVAATMEKWLAAHQTRTENGKRMPDAPEYVETPTSQKVMAALGYAQMAGDVAIIYGGAGLGKTRTLRHYANSHNNVWLATMTPAFRTAVSVMTEVSHALGIREFHGRAPSLHRAITQRLEGAYGLLIIDEAQHVALSGLDQLRSIHDATGVGLALVGNETVYGRMTGGSMAPYLDRLFSRIGKRVHIKRPYKDDITNLAAAWGISDAERLGPLRAIASKPGALRIMTKVLRLAGLYAAGREEDITEQDIQHAWKELGGNGD